jgi:hypothetical protein
MARLLTRPAQARQDAPGPQDSLCSAFSLNPCIVVKYDHYSGR